MLAGAEEGELAGAELAGDLGEEGGGIGIAHVVRVSAWREVDSHAAGLPDGGDGIDDLQQETQAVFERSAVFVRAVVGGVLEELVDEIAVGGMEFHAIETGGFGVLRAAAELFDDVLDFGNCQRMRGDEVFLRPDEADVTCRGDRAGGDGQFAIEIERVRDPADVPELEENAAAVFMHGAGDELPSLDLFLRPDSRCVRIADAARRDGGGF